MSSQQRTQPGPMGLNFTVEDVEAGAAFYKGFYPYDEVRNGAFAGIRYVSLMRDDEVHVCFFEKGPDNPLHDSFPTIQVESVTEYQEKITAGGGDIIVPTSPCPCTGAPFSVIADSAGNQVMIKQAHGTS